MTGKKTSGAENAVGGVTPSMVRKLAEIIADTGLTEIELEHGDLRVRVAREPAEQNIYAAAPAMAPPQALPAPAAPAPTPAPVQTHATSVPETPAPTGAVDAARPGAVPSPMVGTVYLASDPDTPAFIKVGQTVAKGDTLLLIEAMKTFNPIPAPKSGKVVEILVTDSQPVEFGEALVILG